MRVAIEEDRSYLEIDAWMPSEVKGILPLVDWLTRLIEESHCVAGHEAEVELALEEAVSNAVVHGNQMDADKLVHIQCQCEVGKGASIIVTDEGAGFDPNAIPNPLAIDKLNADHGRGVHLMKVAMDEVSFARGGAEVRMWKGARR